MPDTAILDNVTNQFLTALSADAYMIQMAAKSLFYYLAVIQLSLTAIVMTLSGDSLHRMFTKFVKLSCVLGIFYALITHGGQWIPSLLNGFIDVGQRAGLSSLDPSSIIDQGVSISGAILKGLYNTGLIRHPFVSIVGAIVCISIIIIYAFMAAELTIALVKSYVLVAVGSLFFAFGASDYTSDMTRNYFKAVVGLGLKLMCLYLLLGVGQMIGANWAHITEKAAKAHELIPMLVILAAVIVYYMILKNIPPFVAGLAGIGGFRNYGDTAVAMAINAGTTGTNTLMRGARMAGGSAQSAGQMAQAGMQVASSLSTGFSAGGGSAKGAYNAVKTAGSNLGSATLNTAKDMVMRDKQHLSAGQKFNAHMANKIRKGKD